MITPSRPTPADLADIVLDALCASDGGNNPFYQDDPEAVSLAHQIAEFIVTSDIARKGWVEHVPGPDGWCRCGCPFAIRARDKFGARVGIRP